MSRAEPVYIKPCVLKHYKQLCAAHGTAPTAAQIKEIRLSPGTHNDGYITRHFEYALLYFLQRSAIVFEEDTLLLGWNHQPDGTKQEIWYKLIESAGSNDHSSLIYLQRGAPYGSRLWIRFPQPLCDEWHPSLAAICIPSIWEVRNMRYAYFTSTIRSMRANPPPPSIEDSTQAKPKLSITLRRAAISGARNQKINASLTSRSSPVQDYHTLDTGPKENTYASQDAALNGSESPSADSTREIRLRSRTVNGGKRMTQSDRDHDLDGHRKRVKRSEIVDLTESDSEEVIKSEPETSTAPSSHQEEDMPAEQELRDMLQSKKVNEIKDMLAKRSGQLPDWIEEVVKQEMKKKMARDLAMVKNFF